MLVPQRAVVEQLPLLLESIRISDQELADLRLKLLEDDRQQDSDETTGRQALQAQHAGIVKEIGELFSRRNEAEAMGILDEVDLRLADLRRQRDAIQRQLNPVDDNNDWKEKAVQSFQLFERLQEAIFCGSGRCREVSLGAIASNYTVDGKKLVPLLRSPFRQSRERQGVLTWWAELYDARTEIAETCHLLETAYRAFQHGPLF